MAPHTAARTTATAPRLFRQHTQATHLGTPLLQQLCQEWTDLHHSPSSTATIHRWHTTYPALDGLHSPGDITDHLDAACPRDKDQVMLALLDAFHHGDQLAGRILLQAMLPGLTHLTRRVRAPRGTHHDETLQRTLTEFWYVITTTRTLPPRGVAGRLQLDTLHRLTSHRRDADVWEDHTIPLGDGFTDDDPAVEPGATGTPSQDTPGAGCEYDADAGLLELLMHARDTQIITAGEAQFLAEVYVFSDTMAHAARRLGKQPTAVRQRCTRLRQRLITAVTNDHTHDQTADELLSA